MSDIHGTWYNETNMMGMIVELTQEIRADGTYQTRMVYPTPHGGKHHIVHDGTYEAADGQLSLSFQAGQMKREGCNDPSNDFELRPLTEEEIHQARDILEGSIPYEIDGDSMSTVVNTPMGPMKVVYTRKS